MRLEAMGLECITEAGGGGRFNLGSKTEKQNSK